jgi:hypothetical protein
MDTGGEKREKRGPVRNQEHDDQRMTSKCGIPKGRKRNEERRE